MTAMAQALSAALLHFIWQGTVVAFLLWIALLLLRNRTANARYIAGCAALALMAALPAITAWMLYLQPAAVTIPAAISTAVPGAERIARESAPLSWIALWRQWALPVWSVGVFLFALRLVLGCRHVAALRRLGHAAEGQIAETVSQIARRMQAGRAIRVLISNVAESPSVVGWLRPAILLPAATLAGLEPEQLMAVLAHEIAHIRRHDYLVNLAQTLVETVLFYHPAVWWASARIRHERELCCDDAAVAVCGDAICYARALTSLERLRVMTPRLALGSTGGSLLYRIERLAGVRREIGLSKLPGIAALALGLACFAMTVHWAKAQQMTQQPRIPRELGIAVSTTGEVLHRSRVPYPENGIQGTVLLEATLDQSGNVADAHVLSGPPELRKAALQSVLQWQFANAWAGETQQISITFQEAHARAQQESQEMATQGQLTEAFLKDELRAAQERGDSKAIQDLQEKTNLVQETNRIEAEQGARTETQLAQLKVQLEEARMSLTEEHPKVAALLTQIDALNEQIARFKQENQGLLLADGADTNQTGRFLESQFVELTQKLADARKSLGEMNPQVVNLRAQFAELAKKSEAAHVGSPLARIEINGLIDAAKAGLAARLNIKVGEILSQAAMESTVAAVRGFDPRLECRWHADGGNVTLQIVPWGTDWQEKK